MVIVTDKAALFVTLVEVYDDGVTVAVCEATVTEPTLGASTFAVTLVAVATPRDGVVRLGEVLSTLEPEPVEVVTPVPPLATGRVPVTPVASETLVIVFVEPEIDLFVRVSVVTRPTRVSDELGIAIVTVVVAFASMIVVPVAPPITPFDR